QDMAGCLPSVQPPPGVQSGQDMPITGLRAFERDLQFHQTAFKSEVCRQGSDDTAYRTQPEPVVYGGIQQFVTPVNAPSTVDHVQAGTIAIQGNTQVCTVRSNRFDQCLRTQHA